MKPAGKGRPGAEFVSMTDEELEVEIAKGHDYRFIGKTGLFCPIQKGHGGGLLMRKTDDGKHYSVTGTKGYRWMEAETVKGSELEHVIDESFYVSLVDEAIEDISKYGDFEMFTSGRHQELDSWSPVPCGDMKYPTCFDCGKFLDGTCDYTRR